MHQMVIRAGYLLILMLVFPPLASAQSRTPIWYTPSGVTEINGLAIGPINSAMMDEKPRQTINDIHAEIGFGFLMPMMPTHPFRGSEMYPSRKEDIDSALTYDATSIGRGRIVNVNGMSLSPLGSLGLHTINGLYGSMFAGIALRVNGLAINPVLNFVASVNGVAISGLSNSSIYVSGLQAAIVSNDAFESHGMQFAAFNGSDLHYGLQIGGLNTSTSFHGVQFGIVNITDELHGLQIGILNISSDGWMPFVNWD